MKKVFLIGFLTLLLAGTLSLGNVQAQVDEFDVENLALRGGLAYTTLGDNDGLDQDVPDSGRVFYLGTEYTVDDFSSVIAQYENISASNSVDISASGLAGQYAYEVYTVDNYDFNFDIAVKGGAGYYFSGEYGDDDLESSFGFKAGAGLISELQEDMDLNFDILYRSLEMDIDNDNNNYLDLSGLELSAGVTYNF
ncbi:MAG: outer membrane beta-barrel protein [Bacillota bacterium]